MKVRLFVRLTFGNESQLPVHTGLYQFVCDGRGWRRSQECINNTKSIKKFERKMRVQENVPINNGW